MSRRASITICVPTRNRAGSLRQTLLAMQRQTVPYDELIVGDDASEDDTRGVVEEFRDDRIQYVRHARNIGLYQNWNDLIGRASGDYICIYHDHDWYLPEILEKSRQLLDDWADVAFVHTALLFVDAADEIVNADIRPFPPVMRGADLRRILATGWNCPVMAATAMVRREAYRSVGPYRPERYGLGCDQDMWFQLAQVGDVGYVAEPQALIRVRERGRETARFSWANEWGLLHMREDEIAEVFAQDPAARAEAERRLRREASGRFLARAIRAVLLEPPEVWARDEAQVQTVFGTSARSLYLAVKRLSPLRKLLKSVGLPLHYRRIAQAERAARQRARAIARVSGIPFPPPATP